MKSSKESAVLWDRANTRNNARRGIGDRAAAFDPVTPIKDLIASVGKNPNALELLAARSHEMTPEQRTAAIRAGLPPKVSKPKAKPKATTPLSRRIIETGARTLRPTGARPAVPSQPCGRLGNLGWGGRSFHLWQGEGAR